MSSCFVTTIDLSLQEKLRQDLLDQGFSLSPAPYSCFLAKKEKISCQLYLSGKLMVQGKGMEDFITYYLEPEILKNLSYTHPEVGIDLSPRIGLDEAGKGDFFGPLCMAGLYADEAGIRELLQLKVKDSKKLSDRSIIALSSTLKARFPHKILSLFPSTYNRLYAQFHNLNRLLAWGHATVLEDLSKATSCKKALLDQFAHESLVEGMLKQKHLSIELTQRVRAEEDPVVAAASILARAAFVEGIAKLEEHYQVQLPKGASSLVIQAGQKIVTKHGQGILSFLSKTHFKTTDAVISSHD